jgi:Peptidase family M23
MPGHFSRRLDRRQLLKLAAAGSLVAATASWLKLPGSAGASSVVTSPQQVVSLTVPFRQAAFVGLQRNWHGARTGDFFWYNHRTTVRAHDGEDMACNNLTPVYACVSGRTVSSSAVTGDSTQLPYSRYGNVVVIENSAGDLFLYAHLADGSALAPGNNVVEGQTQVGLASFTGNATGPHLHLEVRLADFACPNCAASYYFPGGYPIDPAPSLQAAVSAGRFSSLPAPPPDPEPPQATTVNVSSIAYSLSRGRLRVTLTLVDDLGRPVGGAAVTARITNTSSGRRWSRSGSTAADGKVTLPLNNVPAGCYTTRVTSVASSGLTWDGATPPNGPFCK